MPTHRFNCQLICDDFGMLFIFMLATAAKGLLDNGRLCSVRGNCPYSPAPMEYRGACVLCESQASKCVGGARDFGHFVAQISENSKTSGIRLAIALCRKRMSFRLSFAHGIKYIFWEANCFYKNLPKLAFYRQNLKKFAKNCKSLMPFYLQTILIFSVLHNLTFGVKLPRHREQQEQENGMAKIEMGQHENGKKTILYCSDNKYHSHFQFSIELAQKLREKYIVHFAVLDHYHEEKDENDEIYKSVEPDENFLLIRIPIDGNYLQENFTKHVKGGFSNWENEKVRTEIPDFWVLEEMNTINMYQAVAIQNPQVKVSAKHLNGQHFYETNILGWLRLQRYALAIAEWGRLTASFALFHELGIEKMVATAAPAVNPAYYHFIGMHIPLDIPEFFAAQPQKHFATAEEEQQFRNKNKKDYTSVIKRYEKIFFEKNVKTFNALRKTVPEHCLKETPPLREMLAKCRAFMINQPAANVDFGWKKSEMVKHIGGIAINKMELYAAKIMNRQREYEEELGKIKKDNLWKNEEGCIVLFTFGTILNFDGMPPKTARALFNAFAKHKDCKFLVRFDEKMYNKLLNDNTHKLEKADNVFVLDYKTKVAQQEIFGQKNLRALVTHCGQNTFNEAVYAGIPLICIPFFYDQPYNAALIEHLKIGIYVKPTQIVEKFENALERIIKEKMFLENVRKIAHDLHKQNEKESKPKLFRDTIDALLEREIIFENEFVNESNGKAIEAY